MNMNPLSTRDDLVQSQVRIPSHVTALFRAVHKARPQQDIHGWFCRRGRSADGHGYMVYSLRTSAVGGLATGQISHFSLVSELHSRVFIHHWRSTLLLIWFANRYCLLVAVPLKVLMDNLCFKKVKSFPSLMVA